MRRAAPTVALRAVPTRDATWHSDAPTPRGPPARYRTLACRSPRPIGRDFSPATEHPPAAVGPALRNNAPRCRPRSRGARRKLGVPGPTCVKAILACLADQVARSVLLGSEARIPYSGHGGGNRWLDRSRDLPNPPCSSDGGGVDGLMDRAILHTGPACGKDCRAGKVTRRENSAICEEWPACDAERLMTAARLTRVHERRIHSTPSQRRGTPARIALITVRDPAGRAVPMS